MMHYTKSPLFLCCFAVCLTCSVIACAQDRLVAKDDPAVPAPSANNTINNPIIQDLLNNSEKVEAYTFEKDRWKTVRDTSATTVRKFKPINHIEKLQAPDVSTLKVILNSDITYEAHELMASCGWHPDLGFIFKKGEKKLTVLVSTMKNCNVIKIYHGTEQVLSKMCSPGRTSFVKLAKVLFPEEYENIPEVIAIPTEVIETPPADSTQQNTAPPSEEGGND